LDARVRLDDLLDNFGATDMKSRLLSSLSFAVFLTLAINPATARDDLPEITIDGLERVKDTELAVVYAEPGVDFSQYNKINLVETYVSFKKNWRRDQNGTQGNRITSGDMDQMKAELAAMFRDVFTKVLEEGGYELVDSRAEDILTIKPAIINLDIKAPDTNSVSQSRSYTESAGEMTLYLELYDSVTDDLIAKAMDRQKDRKTGYFRWQTRVTNRAAANRILKVWANVLKDGLDEARGVTTQ
jgi:ribosomal protein L17